MTLRPFAPVILALALIATTGCNDKKTTRPGSTADSTYVAVLNAAQESPSPSADTGSGTGVFTLSADRSQLAFRVTFGGLSGPAAAAHIHMGAPGVPGGVVRAFSVAEIQGNTISGTWTASDSQPLTADMVDSFRAGNLYVNVHTQDNPAGEIRGQIVPPGGGDLFVAKLDAGQETSSPTVDTGSGTAFFTFDQAGNALHFQVSFGGLSGPAAAAHIHMGDEGVAGGVVRAFSVAEFHGNSITGTWSGDDAQPLTADLVTALRAGKLYANVHTQDNAGGEIRGQILPVN